MTQSCPHCGTNYKVDTTNLTKNWAFAKCCGCSALNIIESPHPIKKIQEIPAQTPIRKATLSLVLIGVGLIAFTLGIYFYSSQNLQRQSKLFSTLSEAHFAADTSKIEQAAPQRTIAKTQVLQQTNIETSISSGLISVRSAIVRSGPSTNYRIIASLPQGTVINILEKKENWSKISSETAGVQTAWVRNDLIKEQTQ